VGIEGTTAGKWNLEPGAARKVLEQVHRTAPARASRWPTSVRRVSLSLPALGLLQSSSTKRSAKRRRMANQQEMIRDIGRAWKAGVPSEWPFEMRVSGLETAQRAFINLSSVGLYDKFRKESLTKLARLVAKRIKANISKGGNPTHPLHPMTVALKGRKKPLRRTGNLRKSVKVVPARQTVQVTFSNADARRAAYIAENGATIQVTTAMRRFFAANGFPLRNSTSVIHIKARPIIAPALDEVAAEPGMKVVMESMGLHLDRCGFNAFQTS